MYTNTSATRARDYHAFLLGKSESSIKTKKCMKKKMYLKALTEYHKEIHTLDLIQFVYASRSPIHFLQQKGACYYQQVYHFSRICL